MTNEKKRILTNRGGKITTSYFQYQKQISNFVHYS